jgi:hypothetical protein
VEYLKRAVNYFAIASPHEGTLFSSSPQGWKQIFENKQIAIGKWQLAKLRN